MPDDGKIRDPALLEWYANALLLRAELEIAAMDSEDEDAA